MSSENCSHTLIFAADNVDGRLLFPAELRGRAVKAGLGVSERANAGLLTASLFSDSNGVGHSYETRQDVGRVIEEAIASIGREQFWGQLEIAGIDFGRLLMPWLWHALEAPLLLLRLLGRWCDREMPFGLATWRIDVPPPAVRGALEAFCEARRITLSHLASPRPADTSSGPVAEMSAIQGAYPFQGTVGQEVLAARHGFSRGLDQFIEYGQLCLKGQGPWHFAAWPEGERAKGIFLECRLDHVFTDAKGVEFCLAAGGRAVVLRLDAAGALHNHSLPQASAWLGLLGGSSNVGMLVGCIEGRAYFSFTGRMPIGLSTVPFDGADGLHIRFLGSDQPGPELIRFERFAFGPLDRSPGLLEGLDAAYGVPSALPARCDPRAARRVAVLVPGRGHCVSYTQEFGFDDAPMRHEGLFNRLRQRGVTVEPIFVSAPWIIDNRPVDAPATHSLFANALSPEQSADAAEVRDRLAEIANQFEKSILSGPGLLYDHVDLKSTVANLFREQTIAIAAQYGHNVEFARLFRLNPPDLVFGPQLDSSYFYALAAARAEHIPTVSLEISFMFHEANRMHRRFNREEVADALCYWGTAAVRRLRKLGLASTEQVVTGLHTLDFYRAAAPDRLRVLKDKRVTG